MVNVNVVDPRDQLRRNREDLEYVLGLINPVKDGKAAADAFAPAPNMSQRLLDLPGNVEDFVGRTVQSLDPVRDGKAAADQFRPRGGEFERLQSQLDYITDPMAIASSVDNTLQPIASLADSIPTESLESVDLTELDNNIQAALSNFIGNAPNNEFISDEQMAAIQQPTANPGGSGNAIETMSQQELASLQSQRDPGNEDSGNTNQPNPQLSEIDLLGMQIQQLLSPGAATQVDPVGQINIPRPTNTGIGSSTNNNDLLQAILQQVSQPVIFESPQQNRNQDQSDILPVLNFLDQQFGGNNAQVLQAQRKARADEERQAQLNTARMREFQQRRQMALAGLANDIENRNFRREEAASNRQDRMTQAELDREVRFNDQRLRAAASRRTDNTNRARILNDTRNNLIKSDAKSRNNDDVDDIQNDLWRLSKDTITQIAGARGEEPGKVHADILAIARNLRRSEPDLSFPQLYFKVVEENLTNEKNR